MPTSKCLRCGLLTDTLAASGLCTVCVSETQMAAQRAEAEAGTLSRDPHDTATHASPDEWAGVLPAGGYRYEEQIGVGGMGVVWRAVRVSTGQVVAIKKLKPDTFTPAHTRRFVAEAHVLSRVEHENVVKLHDFVPDPADPFLVLEYVPGESLSDHIKSVGPLHPDRAARILIEAADGIEAANARGIIHRDLKPGNLLLTRQGHVKVADFGLGKVLAEADVPTRVGSTAGDDGDTPQGLGTLTAAGRLAGGTPGFMAPEQVSNKYGEVSRATDVWGLGGCLFACLTAQAPFPVGRANMERVLTAPLVPPRQIDPSVPADLSAIVVKCLTKDPAGRYESAAAVAADLKRYLAGDETTARRHPWLRRQWRKVQQTPAWVFATAVTVLAVAGGITLAMVPWRKDDPPVAPPDPVTPESIQSEYRRDLKDGKAVTLVGPTGLPRHHRWRLGSAALVESWHGDGGCAFETIGHSLLELWDDPGVDRYLVRAELRQLASQRLPDGQAVGYEDVGLYVGFASTPGGQGEGVMSMLRITFSDRDPLFHVTKKLQDQQVQSAAAVHFIGPDRSLDPPRLTHASFPFRPAEKRPGPWRTVEYEVTPAGVTPRWSPDARPPAPIAPQVPLDAVAEYAAPQGRVGKVFPGVRLPAWTPRAPLGLYCHSSALAARNVVVIPLPAR